MIYRLLLSCKCGTSKTICKIQDHLYSRQPILQKKAYKKEKSKKCKNKLSVQCHTFISVTPISE